MSRRMELALVNPPRVVGQLFSSAVYEPRAVRSTLRLPLPFAAARDWAACDVCGHPTRARRLSWKRTGAMQEQELGSPRHLACRPRRSARKQPNRHDRRRAGIPRPPLSEERALVLRYGNDYDQGYSDEGYPVDESLPEELPHVAEWLDNEGPR